MKTLLCSAFPGTGKTYFFNNSDKTVLDSDSSTFDKSQFPANYIKYIKDNIGKIKLIFISSHKIVRDALVENGLDFVLVYPSPDLKDDYIQRYKKRGNAEGFVDLLLNNWDNWMIELENQKGCRRIVLQKGQYISDVI